VAIRADTLRLVAEVRSRTGDLADGVTRRLIAAWARAHEEITAELVAAVDDLVVAGGGQWPTPAQIARSARATRALAIASEALERLADLARAEASVAAAQAAQATASAQAGIIASQLPEQAGDLATLTARFQRVSASALAEIVARTTMQITSLTRPLSAQATEAMRRELVRGIAVGDNPRVAARRMVERTLGVFDGGLTRALTIARTEILDAYRNAAAAGQIANADVLIGWVWLAELGARTCPACWAMHGSVHPVDELGPLGHPNCVVAGTVVSGPAATAAVTRWYEGEVVDIAVAGRDVLTVTPNHPILTPQGWVPAGLLHEGDHVVGSLPGDVREVHRGPDDQQVPSLVQDVAQALRCSPSVSSVAVPTAAEDFHGDGAGSKVHVVTAHGLLRDGLDPAVLEHLCQSKLVPGDPCSDLLAGLGDLPPVSLTVLGASRGGLCLQHSGRSLLRGPGLGDDLVRLAHGAQGYSGGDQASGDGLPGHLVAAGQGGDGLPAEVSGGHLLDGDRKLREDGLSLLGHGDGHRGGGVSPQPTLTKDAAESLLAYPIPSRGDLAAFTGDVVVDRVLHVRRRSWSGHVYNLQTDTGWYFANGIVTHNCRCARTPKVKPWRDLGFDIDEPADLIPDARTRFTDLPRATQLQIMGPGRLAALDRGQVAWPDLARRQSNPGWRDSYTPAPVSALT
jgi:hypothetical protein